MFYAPLILTNYDKNINKELLKTVGNILMASPTIVCCLFFVANSMQQYYTAVNFMECDYESKSDVRIRVICDNVF
jgi:ABC-type phosphate transport system permease subunit